MKRRLGVKLTTHPYPVPRSRMSRSYAFSPSWRQQGGSWTALLYVNDENVEIGLTNMGQMGEMWELVKGEKWITERKKMVKE
jgi:hypothetical protein